MSPQPNTGVYATNSLATVVNMQYNYPAAPNNNGKACLATDAITGEQIVYSYDSLNRLSSASAYTFSGTPSTGCAQTTGSTATWTQSYALDGFGNLTDKAGTGGGPNVPIGVNPTNNQITDGAPQYDANGNLTAQSGVSYTYDAENRMSYFSSVSNGNRTFAYDSQNKRILNWTGSTDQYGNASGYTVYYYGVKGERLGVYNFTVGYWAAGTTPTLENSTTSTETFFGARRLAPLDRLGSARSINSTASSYYPFGEDKSTNPAIDAWKFGTYWRDSASGLDYADQRYYSSTLGRFTTPDPSASSAHSSSPKSWNKYTYTLSDPFNSNDPSRLDTEVCPPATGDSVVKCYSVPDGADTQVPDGSTIMNTESVTVTATPDPVDPYQASFPGTFSTVGFSGQSGNPGGTGTSGANQPSAAKQQCIQAANQKLASAKTTAFNSTQVSFWQGALATVGAQAVAGCIIGALPTSALAGFLTGTTLIGAGSWPLVPVGCFTGAVDQVLIGLPSTFVVGAISASIGYWSAIYTAENAYNQQIKACNNIP